METVSNSTIMKCQLLAPIRDRGGKVRFREAPEVLREVDNLGRRMLLARFEDGTSTFLFPHEVRMLDQASQEI